MSKPKTKSMSCRVEEDLKDEFMELLDSQNMIFAKWLRCEIKNYIKKQAKKGKKK